MSFSICVLIFCVVKLFQSPQWSMSFGYCGIGPKLSSSSSLISLSGSSLLVIISSYVEIYPLSILDDSSEILPKLTLCRCQKRWIQYIEHLKFSIFIIWASRSVFDCKIGSLMSTFDCRCCLTYVRTTSLRSLCCTVRSHFS